VSVESGKPYIDVEGVSGFEGVDMKGEWGFWGKVFFY